MIEEAEIERDPFSAQELQFLEQQGKEEEKEGMSYADLYSSIVLNTEVIITIPTKELERIKTGLKNFKSKQATKFREQGIPVEDSSLLFQVVKSTKEITELQIALVGKPTLPIMEIKIPDREL